jgi:hypothetical protein
MRGGNRAVPATEVQQNQPITPPQYLEKSETDPLIPGKMKINSSLFERNVKILVILRDNV